MDRDSFVGPRRERWRSLEALLVAPFRSASDWSNLAALYRAVCADLAAAHSQQLPDDVTRYLDELAGRAHNQIYSVRDRKSLQLLSTVMAAFPSELRRQWRFFLLSTALFYGPFAVGLFGALASADFAGSVLPLEMLRQMEESFASDVSRGGTDDAMMAGFYVNHNVGIAFRTFATGALFGLGSAFFLVYNGLVIGTVAGYVAHVGHGLNLLTFIAGHSAWELTAVTVAGAAGLRLGWAMIVTGGRTREGSMRAAAPELYRMVLGAAAMLLVAAAIEGFWSASPVPAPAKWVFGVIQWLLVTVWLAAGGRR